MMALFSRSLYDSVMPLTIDGQKDTT